MLRVTHMSPSTAVNARAKKLIDKIPPAKIHMEVPPLPHHQTVPCHFTFNADWLTDDWLCSPVDMSNKNPTAMCRPTLNFFPAINRNFFPFFHFSLLVYLKISCQFCLLLYMLNENEIITRCFFCVWLMGVLMSSLSLFTHKRWA